jgi:hypothetical protein
MYRIHGKEAAAWSLERILTSRHGLMRHDISPSGIQRRTANVANRSTVMHCVELRIARAYMRLAFASQRADGAKAVSLGRFGSYEVLLVEFAQPAAVHDAQLWIELYDHTLQSGLDSCGCTDIEEAAVAARYLLLRAQQLSAEIDPVATKG